MGLGTVLSVDQRTVTILFIATGETRIYAKQSAPLTRIMFEVGDNVQSHDGERLRVEQIEEYEGLLTYIGKLDDGTASELEEGQLNSFIQLNRPTQRLFNGQLDRNRLFELRYQTRLQLNQLAHSELRGLSGVRTSLIPHQLYIAHEVANRYAPRVLLADEVGLGKTIEAGLILHQQLLTEQAQRVLIVVPESLLHQWLVEMVRRFNLRFSLLDEARCLAIEESGVAENPFQAEQLVICNLEFLLQHPERQQQAIAGEWDLLVIDEAHHLQWSPQQISPEYRVVEQLAAETRGVLLLTATPEQLGKESHFARLRLLDPDRFHSFDAFLEEEQGYEPIAHAVELLLGDQPLDARAQQALLETIDEGDNRQLLETLESGDSEAALLARSELVDHLLDRHGTGRILFRNTRSAVKGFPTRHLNAYPLPLPEAYSNCLQLLQSAGLSEPQLLLSPELLYQASSQAGEPHWSQIDPRVSWLDQQLKQLKPEKVLVITASADSALDLADALRVRSGHNAGVFHEGMSILERDRAAAWFADVDYGCQLLICSEIGSEGRNFQFAHHLVLFDLPLNPDLLEQRIGRLDRIGQREMIEIHIPYLEQSAQEVMFSWYHQGLGAFEQTCPAGHNVFAQVEETLVEALHQIDDSIEDLPALVTTTHQLHQQMNHELQQGRDRLLEYNSCRPQSASQLKEVAEQLDDDSELPDYLEYLLDAFGVESEPHTSDSMIIRPGEQTQAGVLPGLSEEGVTITTDRDTALSNEDMQFLTWEHPMVSGAMEAVTGSELGNSAVTAIRSKHLEPGQMYLECLYIIESASNRALHSDRYLPPTTLCIVVDSDGKDMGETLDHETIKATRERLDRTTANKIIHAYTKELREMIDAGERHALQRAPEILSSARNQADETLQREIERLNALVEVNPNVRREEVDFFEQQLAAVTEAIESAAPRLDALRIVIST